MINGKMDIKVLYAEDDNDVRELLTSILSQRVSEVLVAKDGKEALEIFENNHDIDVVVTDIEMPKMTGLELIREIKKEINYPYIVITTAFNDTDFLLDAIELRINKFLFKPIRAQQLFDILEEISYTVALRKENLKNEKLLTEYKNAIDSSSLVHITDLDGNITYINENFSKVFGYSSDEIVSKNISTINSPLETKYNEVANIIKEKKVWQGELRHSNSNGETVITECVVSPIINVDGSIKEYLTISYDITEKINQQRENQKLQAKIRQDEIKSITEIKNSQILKFIPVPSCIINKNKIITDTNSEFIELFDYIEMKQVRESLNSSKIDINELFINIPDNLNDNFSNFIDDYIDEEDIEIIQKDNNQKYILKYKDIENKIIVSLYKKDG
jgi:PAS domain S-box-containing protein